MAVQEVNSTNPAKPHDAFAGGATDHKAILRLGAIGAIAASLCCFTPVVLVMIAGGVAALLGPEILGAANQDEVTQRVHELTDQWYDDYKWAFRAFGLLAIAGGLWYYFRRRGICTLDAARRHRNRIINVSLLTVTFGTGAYLAWNYVILHYWGIGVGLPW